MNPKEHSVAIGPAHISTYPLPKGGMLLPKEAKWEEMPKGWTADSRSKFSKSIGGEADHREGPVDTCMTKIDGHVDDPGAFCASLHDQVTGTTGWRGKKEAMGSPLSIGAKLTPKLPSGVHEADSGSAFPQVLRGQKKKDAESY